MKRILGVVTAAAILLSAVGVSLVFAQAGGNKYMGSDKCKNCHSSDKKGNQYGKWSKTKMAQSSATLATPASKDIATKAGIADATKSDKCLKCHTTAFGAPKDQLDANFKPANVQCEACHGPGGNHVKARMAAAAAASPDVRAKVPADEIVAHPKVDVCTKCHSKESPSFKPFNFDEAKKAIAHPDPRSH